VTGLANDYREILVTSVADAELDHSLWLPSSSLAPFVTALATTVLFVGSIFTPWAVVWAALPVAAGATWWFWPKKDIVEQRTGSEVSPYDVEVES
jgi:cytochrome c oxidase subunit 1